MPGPPDEQPAPTSHCVRGQVASVAHAPVPEQLTSQEHESLQSTPAAQELAPVQST